MLGFFWKCFKGARTRLNEKKKEEIYTGHQYIRGHTHLTFTQTHTGNWVSSPPNRQRFGLLVMHSKKIREDRENIKHRRVTKKQSMATIKLATLFNMEAAFSNFQAPGFVLYSDGLIPLSTRKSATNGHPPNNVSFHWRDNKSSAVNSTDWCNILYFSLSRLLCLRMPTNLCLHHLQ